ncbi:MAG: hypothetical protein CMQ19_13130 [Gammaproteobacteria bacterium]|jgi:hypothetical protein|nr:hypothetical protein [Gammaproteobacteria bacterium]|tara:strand:- start:1986 stop:2342 length:357 start_codon:yes stop_codon:yes gene_type:complete
MTVLAINLDKSQSDAITCELGETVCAVENLEDGCVLVEKEEFSKIIYCITADSPNLAEITNLVGLTLISTRIILIGQPEVLAARNDWCGLGVELLPNPTVNELIHGIEDKSIQSITKG